MRNDRIGLGYRALNAGISLALVLGCAPTAALAEALEEAAADEVAAEQVFTEGGVEEEADLAEASDEVSDEEALAADADELVALAEEDGESEDYESYDDEKIDLSWVDVFISDQAYTGKQVKPKIDKVVYVSWEWDEENEIDIRTERVLKEGVDYQIVEYGDNINPGNGWLALEGLGDFTGSYYPTFEIQMASSSGWKKVGKYWRYYAPDGAKVFEYQGEYYDYARDGFYTITGKRYLFDAAGNMLTGWQKRVVAWDYDDGSPESYTEWYYLGSDGAARTGWQKIGGKWYYFYEDEYSTGLMATGIIQVGTDGRGPLYWLGDDGALKTGWHKMESRWYDEDGNGHPYVIWRYFTTNGAATGWKKISGKWYYFDPMGLGAMATGWRDVDGKSYVFKESGAMATGWVQTTVTYRDMDGSEHDEPTWFYCKSNGVVATGWNKIGGKWYYLGSHGPMVTGWQYDGGAWYYLGKSGAMVTGWQKIDGNWYYFNGSGAMQTAKWISGKYYVDEDGIMVTDTVIDGKYYVDKNGKWDGKTIK